MSQEVTLDALIHRVYLRGGWERETSRHTPGTVVSMLNLSLMALRDRLLRVGLVDPFLEEASIPTVAGTSRYTVEDGYYQIIGVDVSDGSCRVPLQRFAEHERPTLLDTNAMWTGRPLRYQTVGDSDIELLPVPSGVYTLTLRYVPATLPLVADDDTVNGFNGYEEWAVADTIRKLAFVDRDWPLAQALESEMKVLEERIATMARMRDRASSKRVVDVRGGYARRCRRF